MVMQHLQPEVFIVACLGQGAKSYMKAFPSSMIVVRYKQSPAEGGRGKSLLSTVIINAAVI